MAKSTESQSNDLSQFKTFEPYVEEKGEEYMSASQLEHFKKILLAWKQQLMEEVDRTVGSHER